MSSGINISLERKDDDGIFARANIKIRQLSDFSSAVLFCGLLLLLFFSVISRGALHLSTPWLEEVGSVLCIYFVAFSAISAWIRKAHIAVDIIPSMFSGRKSELYGVFLDLIGVIFFLMAFSGSLGMMSKSVSNKTAVLGVSYSWFYLGLAICFGGILIVTILRILDEIMKKNKKFEGD